VLQEQVEVRTVQTLISEPAVGVINIFPGIHSSAEEHGNEHNLPGPEVGHVYLFKEMAQIIILQNFVIEEFRSSLDSATSPDQFIEVFSHGVLINNECKGDVTTVIGATMATMQRTVGYATALVGLTLTILAWAFRKPSFIMVNGYYAQTWAIWAILGALLLAIGVLIVWRAA
jgi:hypothetical protein